MADLFILPLLVFLLCYPDGFHGKSIEMMGSFVNLADVPCGKTQVSLNEGLMSGLRSSRIVGGSPALPGEFPWTVSIQDDRGVHFCGGFLINKNFIVTAAHCFILYLNGGMDVEDLNKMSIVLGATDLLSKSESLTQTRRIKKLILHPTFSHYISDFKNDIALIELDEDVEWSVKVQPVCLSNSNSIATEEESVDDNGSLQEAEVAGWGKRRENEADKEWLKHLPMYKVNLPLWKNSECQKAYNNLEINWKAKRSHICAGRSDGLGDTCKGDSGSALLTKDSQDKVWTAIGIVSVGEGCAKVGIPGIYTRVSEFLPWILSEISII